VTASALSELPGFEPAVSEPVITSLEGRLRAPSAPPLRAKPQRMSELVAGLLRNQILDGSLRALPRLEDLARQFSVGPAAVREAMRILETEGLVTIRRGNVGGAEVHCPNADGVAYMVSLVLQSKSTKLDDVGAALRHLEPICASLCAARADRDVSLVPTLRALVEEQREAMGDGRRTRDTIDRFHQAIITGCDNDTLTLIVGALQAVWVGHASQVYERVEFDEPDLSKWNASVRDHDRLVEAIALGVDDVGVLARAHLEASHAYMTSLDAGCAVTAASTAAIAR
jgi:GntR family transcriptional regulator, transcriptional repressor for pyruvate dehydrogenase complex